MANIILSAKQMVAQVDNGQFNLYSVSRFLKVN